MKFDIVLYVSDIGEQQDAVDKSIMQQIRTIVVRICFWW